jgi:hypothetical protein
MLTGPGDGASSSLHEHDPGAGNILDASKEHAADTDSTDQTRSDSLDNTLFFMDRDLSYSAETAGQGEDISSNPNFCSPDRYSYIK